MLVDGTRVVPGTARVFPAIGGGWAMKMQIHRKAGCGPGAEMCFGMVARGESEARAFAAWVNDRPESAAYSWAVLERRWRSAGGAAPAAVA